MSAKDNNLTMKVSIEVTDQDTGRKKFVGDLSYHDFNWHEVGEAEDAVYAALRELGK